MSSPQSRAVDRKIAEDAERRRHLKIAMIKDEIADTEKRLAVLRALLAEYDVD